MGGDRKEESIIAFDTQVFWGRSLSGDDDSSLAL